MSENTILTIGMNRDKYSQCRRKDKYKYKEINKKPIDMEGIKIN